MPDSTNKPSKQDEKAKQPEAIRPGFRTNELILSELDKKLMRSMNSSIAKRIGLDPHSPSRSIRV